MSGPYVEVLLIAIGAIVMTYSIALCLKLYRSLNRIRDHISGSTLFLFQLYVVLMTFFLFGYIGTAVTIVRNVTLENSMLIALIFFFGAIFVWVGMVVQTRLTAALHSSNLQMIRTLVSAVEARDINLKGHSRHVAALVMLIFERLPARARSGIDRQKVEYAALLHDIGKLGIPEAVLNKPSRLDPEEWAIMRNHPRIGTQILGGISGFEDIQQWVIYHHERIDGKGYYTLDGENIPFVSKIISVADTYSAIVMRRSYKRAREHREAMRVLLECAGTQLDEEIVKVFEQINELEIKYCQPLLEQDAEIQQDIVETTRITGSGNMEAGGK